MGANLGGNERQRTLSGAEGFTLLEVLVALIIFAMAFGVIAGLFRTSLGQTTRADTLMDASAFAEQQIMRYGADLPLTIGRSFGLSPHGFHWQADIDLATTTIPGRDIALYRITLAVGPDEGELTHITLNTLRLGAAP